MTSTEASQAAAGFAERDLTVHETRVRVLAAGAGRPLLYLHDPPGYLTMASAPRVLGAKRGLGTGRNDLAELIERGYALVGSPATVRQQLGQYAGELGFGIFCGICQFGSLGHKEFERSVRLFADAVMPALRPAGSDRT